ncbi:MAG: hypothetical protein E7614_07735 [Ruminococcaceae bacterium]|nr:hypothetical protein [Oscillospiraceae bacterium]
MDMTEYIYPELIFIVPFLNVTGWWIKHKTSVENKYIPLILGIFATALSSFYIYSSMNKGIWESLWGGTVQGIFMAATAVYANQLAKTSKEEDNDNNN